MAQKTYQKLTKNLDAAKRIYEYLKVYKVMDEKTFAALYFNRSIENAHNPGAYIFDGSYGNRVKTTKQFLMDHDLATFELINGNRVVAATQKCWRTKSFENAIKEVQEVSNDDIDKAIQYVTINNDMVPNEFEGPIVANMLGLEGKHWQSFVNLYNFGIPAWLNIKYKVLSPLTEMVHQGLVKKI